MVEQLTLNQLVPGSSPGGATTFFVLWICRRSSTVEHLFCKQAVTGSNPVAGLSSFFLPLPDGVMVAQQILTLLV